MSLVRADARALPLTAGSVQCCVTSPPYWGLRDYGVHGQLGLEPKPDAYVANMVAVFRQVWRVLRADGVLFLNLGDSYASDTKGSGGRGKGLHADRAVQYDRNQHFEPRKVNHGVKPKDLVGIPWRVAFALQQPYYAGTIRDERDRIWLAAAIDAEGCIFIHKRKAGQSNGQGYQRLNDSYGSGLEVANTSEAFARRCLEITGKGSICHQDNGRKQRLFRWNLRSNECRDVLREVYPYLVAKQQQARLAIGCPSSGERAEAAHAGLIGLHNGFATDVDFPAPAPMTEPGYYLRSDIVWSKLNPMPESVTDRPTKAHEYVFLLTKAERYYWDAEAVKEPASAFGRQRSLRGDRSWQEAERASGGAGADCARDTYDRPERNIRSVWSIATQPYSGAHFATMPEALAERCILAGSRPGDLVLDPFLGSGTVARCAISLGRRAVGTDLNPAYLRLADERTQVTMGLPLEFPA